MQLVVNYTSKALAFILQEIYIRIKITIHP